MSRLPQVHNLDELPPDKGADARRELEQMLEFYRGYSPYFSATGRVKNSWAQMLNNPFLANRVLHLSDYIMHQMPWARDRRPMRELMIQTVSKHERSGFAFFSHWDMAIEAGIGPEKMAAIDFSEDAEVVLNEEERLVVSFTLAALDGSVSDELFEKARGMYGDEGVLEFTVAIAYWAFWCIVMNVLRPDADDRFALDMTT